MHERRSVERRWIYRSATLAIPQLKIICACRLRDLTENGAGIRIDKIPLLPMDFRLSIDELGTFQQCQLIWRHSDFVGVLFR
jgi:hypothetical protein